jgi:hypothetical protein
MPSAAAIPFFQPAAVPVPPVDHMQPHHALAPQPPGPHTADQHFAAPASVVQPPMQAPVPTRPVRGDTQVVVSIFSCSLSLVERPSRRAHLHEGSLSPPERSTG